MTKYELLRDAIINKKQVLGEYQNHYRELCPHTLGTKDGKLHCLFYQFGGFSSKGPVFPNGEKNWRCIPVDELKISEVRTGQFYSSNNHSRGQSCIDFVEIEVRH